MKLGIGMIGAWVLGASLLAACSGAEQTTGTTGLEPATYVAALSVNDDGTDETWVDESSTEPVVSRGCGFSTIVGKVVERFDADASGELSADETAALTEHFGDGDPEHGKSALHPNHGQPRRAALLVESYDTDASGTLEASELEALKADIEARCEARLAKLVAEFDTNGDGALDDAEWQAAHAALRERFGKHHAARVDQFDTNGDGQLDADERTALRDAVQARRDEIQDEFDTNDDGAIDGEERAAFKDHVRACVRDDVPMASEGGAGAGFGRGRPGAPDRLKPVRERPAPDADEAPVADAEDEAADDAADAAETADTAETETAETN